MSDQISNTTSISFEYGLEKSVHTINNTTATATMSKSMDISITSLEKDYYIDKPITYLITIVNNGTKTNPLTLKCNLGTYKRKSGGKNIIVTPLSYSGQSHLYINGVFKSQITPEIKTNEIVFSLPPIAEKSNLLLIYKTGVNTFAPLELNSKIKTIISAKLSETENLLETSHTIPVAEKADIKISKSIVPQMFSQGETLSYNISIYNYGNASAENIKITDTFEPPPILTSIKINEKEISPLDYSYTDGIFNLPTYGSGLKISVPHAKFETNENTGATSVLPSVTNVVVSGVL